MNARNRGPSVRSDIEGIPPYPFAALEEAARAADRPSSSVLRFGIGEPDLPPPLEMIDALRASVGRPGGNAYSSSQGDADLRSAIARFVRCRFGVDVDPDRELAVLIGSKEGLAWLPRIVDTRGGVVAVPDPGYPAYVSASILAGARPVAWPLDPRHGYRPLVERIPSRTRLAYLNYPHNPTGQVTDRRDLREVVEAAKDRRFLLAYDNAYSEITFDSPPAPSIWEVPGAREVALEFHSFSKTFGVPGWRLGFVLGPPKLIGALVRFKSQIDSGPALPLQRAAIAGLDLYRGATRPPAIERRVAEYRRRAEMLVRGLRRWGEEVVPPRGALYVWQRVRTGTGAQEASRWLSRFGILVTPGAAFGDAGSSFVRWSVTRPAEEIAEALRRLGAGEGATRRVRSAAPASPSLRLPGAPGSRRGPG